MPTSTIASFTWAPRAQQQPTLGLTLGPPGRSLGEVKNKDIQARRAVDNKKNVFSC